MSSATRTFWRRSTVRSLRVGVALALALATSSCMPGVAHLKDSSGFVYSDRDGSRLVRYNFEARRRVVLVKDCRANATWPAVSPDGKTIAVGRRLLRNGKSARFQVAFYGLDGQSKGVSRTLWLGVRTTSSRIASIQ
jgi:Tol biopolymer transport system component